MTELREEFASLLLVDDDATFCKVLSVALEKRGFAVSVAQCDYSIARKAVRPLSLRCQ